MKDILTLAREARLAYLLVPNNPYIEEDLERFAELVRADAVPDGWVLVPKEPTQEMLFEAQDRHILPPRMKRLWRILLAAALKETTK